MLPAVTHKIKHKLLTIYINNILHLQLRRDTVVGFDTWYWPGIWSIKMTYPGAVIVTEYTQEDLWAKVIKILENHLMPLD